MRDEDPLQWLNEVLWPQGDGGFRRALRPVEGRTERRWWSSPSLAMPHTLMPRHPRRVAARAARRYHDGKDGAARRRVLAAELVSSSPVEPRWGPFSQLVVADGFDRGVIGGLAAQLGEQRMHVAVTLAGPKSNRKPVLQLLAPDGRCLGFAKVAPDLWNEGLLTNEAGWLGRQARGPLRVPELVWFGDLAGRSVLVQQAVLPPRRQRRDPVATPAASLFAAVAELGPRRRGSIGSSGWYQSVAAVLHCADDVEHDQIVRALGDLGADCDLGAWHGDLASWNLYSDAATIAVIDWEFAAADTPVGFDVCHFHVQVANEIVGCDAAASLRWARERVAPTMVALGVAQGEHDVVWRWYLVELVRRLLALRAAGLDTTRIAHGPAALAYLAAVTPVGAARGESR